MECHIAAAVPDVDDFQEGIRSSEPSEVLESALEATLSFAYRSLMSTLQQTEEGTQTGLQPQH